MKIKSLLKTLMTFAILSTTANLGLGQVSLSGTSYSETFDSISSGLPEGWTVRTGATDTALGETKILATSPTSWSHITGAFKNVASADGLEYDSDATAQENSADRALGVRQTGSFGDPGAAFVFHIANTEGLANFVLEFKLQSLHVSSPRKTTWLVDYGFGSDPTEFTPVTTLPDTLFTGNLSFTNTQVQVNFGNALNNKSENVWIRIVTLSSSSGSSSRATTGIDDFQLNWTTASSSYIVNYSVFGSNGSLSATVDGSSISSGSDVESNKNVVFTAQPDAGYKVKEWKNNGTVVSGNTTNSYTVENLSENINVTVEFELIQKYTLTINIVGNGSVIVNGSNYTMPMLLDGGSEVALSAVATAPWSFDGWTGGLVSTNSNDTVTINSDITITATFIQLPETIVEWTFPDSLESRLASGGIAINLDREISRESEFTGNYSYVVGDGTKAISTTKWEDGADTKYWIIDFTTTGYENITFSSKQKGSNTGPRDFKVQVKLDGTEWIDVANTEITVTNSFTGGVLSDISLPAICNNQGKVYLRWLMTSNTSIGGSATGSAGSNHIDNIIIKGVSTTTSVQHNLTLSSTGNGSTVPVSGIYTYNEGTNISIQAVPDLGWTFTGWSGGGITSTDNPLAVTMDADKAITAQFTEATVEYIVNFSVVEGNGSLTAKVNEIGIASGDTVSNGDNIVFTAIPDIGYRVKEWIHNSAIVENNTTNTFTLENISANATVTVEFELIPIITYAVDFSVIGTNGSLSAKVDSLNIDSGDEIEANKNVVFTALPDSGYKVKVWTNNGNVVSGNTTNTYTVEHLSEAINVTVEFELAPTYTLTINVIGNGSVTVNGTEYTTPLSFSEGSEVALSATTTAPWSFEGWSGGLTSTNSEETITINSDITITATFIQLPETIVEWTFPVTGEDRLASGGIDINLGRMISRESEFTGNYSDVEGNGTRAVSSTKWEDGADSKYWIIDFATTGYENIILSSKQQGSNKGPRDFKVQVKIDGTDWIDVDSSEIIVANNFTSGVLSDIVLPEICNNQGKVYLRWLMTSDTSVNGSTVTSVGANRIDNIIIKGVSAPTSIQHNLTLSSTGNGSTIPVSGTYVYNEGTNIFIQAVPDSGWTFTGWSGEGITSTDNPLDVTMDADKAITAQFTEATGEYIVNFSVVGDNGNLSATVNGVAIVSGDTVSYGDNVIFTALPDSGYKVKEWKNNGTVVSGNTTNIYTVENLSENINVTVEFEQITVTEHILTINVEGEGSVTVNGAEYTAPMLFNDSSVVSLSATPDALWQFEGWSGGLVSTNSEETITINSDLTITAIFTQSSESVLLVEWTFPDTVESRLASGGLAVNLDREISREPEFTADYSYFAGDGTRAISSKKWENGTDTKYWIIDFATTGYENITLSSKQQGSNTGPRDFKVQVKLDGTDWIDVDSSEIVVANNFTSGVLSDIALPEICNNQGKVYLRWLMTSDTSVNGSTVTSVGANRIDNIIIKGVSAPTSIQHNLTLSSTGNGSTIPVSGTYAYNEGTNISIQAVPDSGWTFTGWSGDIASSDNPLAVTMDADKAIAAQFTEATGEYIVNFSVVEGNGNLSATVNGVAIVSGDTVSYGDNVLFTALPDSGYKVKEWKHNGTVVSGNITNTYTVENLSANINVTVEFEQITGTEHTLTINIIGEGSVTVNGAEYTAPILFSDSSVVALSATPSTLWQFEGWSGGLVSTNSEETITINSDLTITAIFTQSSESVLLVEWTFPDTVESRLASGGLAVNLDREISREPEFTADYSYVAGDGTRAISSKKWENGTDTKYWIIDFVTTGYENITLSSKQQGSNTGPRDFKVQVKLDGTDWIDVDSSEIVVANNFTSGVLSDITLPEICNNQGKVYLRWIMTSDSSIGGSTVANTGANRIDNIIIKGVSAPTSIQHNLTLSSTGSGSTIPVSGTYAYNEGTNISIQALPDSGWIFTGWSGDIASSDNPLAVTMDADKAITAQFTEATGEYIVNFSVVGDNGNLSATVNGVAIVSGDTVSYGDNVLFTALPDSGYKVKEWKNNGTVVLGNTTNTYTVENLSENINVTVEFEQITGTEHILTINVEGEGSVTVNGAEYTAPILFNDSSVVFLSATPNALWQFEGWSGGLVSTNSEETITINSDLTITATFTQSSETVVVVEWTFPVTGEDRLASGGIDINLDRMISREPEFTDNYSDVAGNGTRAISTKKWENGTDTKYWIIDFATTGYENITLSSKQQSSNTGPRDFKVQVKLDGTEWIDVDSSEIVVANNFTSGVLSDIALPEICNNQGKVYLRWLMTSDTSVNGSTVTSVGANRIDNIIIKGNVSASSHYSVMLAKNGLGQISPDEGVYSYNSGTSITLQAIPDEGQVFDGWTGDFISNNATETLLVDDNKVVTANFRPFASATIDPVSGDLYEETEYLSTVITWNDANEVISITANQSILIQGEDYTITDIDGNTATLTFNVVEFIISKSIKEAEEILCEISFDVGASSIYTIYNYSVPQFYVTFNVTSGGAPVHNAKISINNEVLYTDETGQNELLLANGTYPYTVEKEGYETASGDVIVDNEDQIVSINLTGIFDQASSKILYYPNPVYDMLTIERENSNKVKLEIYSIEGSLVMKQNFATDKLLLNLGELKGGVYIIKLTDIIKTQTIRIVKQ